MVDWFGSQYEGGTANNINGRAQAIWATTAADGAGNIKTIEAYLDVGTGGSGSCVTRCALYESDGDLIDETEDVSWGPSVTQTDWVTHTFATPVAVTASTTYGIAVCSDADGTNEFITSFYHAQSGFAIQYNDTLVDPPNFDDPIGGSYYDSYERGLYAVYESAPPGPTGPSPGMGMSMGLGFGGPQSAILTAKVPQIGHRTGQMQRPRSRIH